MKHALVEFGRKVDGRSGSFAIYFNESTEKLGLVELDCTRHAGGPGNGGISTVPTPPEILERARKALALVILIRTTEEDKSHVLEPTLAFVGMRYRILSDSSPRTRSPYRAGEVGVVFWSKAFGPFRKGSFWNPPRENVRVGLRRLDGSTVYVRLPQCRLDRELRTADELACRAQELSHQYEFGSVFSGYTWASKQYFSIPERKTKIEDAA